MSLPTTSTATAPSTDAVLLPILLALLAAHRHAFQQERPCQRCVALMLGHLCAFSRHTITQLLVSLGLGGVEWSGFYRLFSFLGPGPLPDIPSWGRSIQQSSRFMSQHPWGVVWPAIVISAAVLAFNILGDALRDRLDPRLKSA
jgi:ABC-type dipeptide/oligopeptide/nickel transport system permease subunit